MVASNLGPGVLSSFKSVQFFVSVMFFFFGSFYSEMESNNAATGKMKICISILW